MTVSHWDRLPDNLKGLVYQFDSTAKIKFQLVLNELETKFAKGYVVKCYHRYRPSTDIEYTYLLHKIQIRRKSKVSKYYVKKTQAMLISVCDLMPREFNDRAEHFRCKARRLVFKWKVFVGNYLQQTETLMRYFKATDGRYLRLLN